MCGRFTLHAPEAAVRAAFALGPAAGLSLQPRYNITPSQIIPVVRASGDSRELFMARWGLVPGWSKQAQSKYSTINARMESVAEKPVYRSSFRHRRCLIPADGFYEWQRSGDVKTPYHIRLQDRSVFAFAGLWEYWEGDDESFHSCAIITMPASGIMARVHTRMPALIDTEDYAAWLDTGMTNRDAIMSQLASKLSEKLEAYPVSPYVNSPKNDDARCIEPLD
jgi:putative SOS response-associated peptidase YedK